VYLYLDAPSEKVRQYGQIRNAAVLIAVGVGTDGKRKVLGNSVSPGEQKVHWRLSWKVLSNGLFTVCN